MADPLDTLREELTALTQAGLRRRMREIRGPHGAELEVEGRRAINFASNDYLGLAGDPCLVAGARTAMDAEGVGAAASRLIAGNLLAHRALESELAAWKQTDAALVFSSGYQANVGLISALTGPDDLVFSDALNHASLVDGCRLARTRVVIYAHADPDDLAGKLAEHVGRRRLIVTESRFSMDGDAAPLAELSKLAREHEALFCVDDAHALGVEGAKGVGACAGHAVDVQIGTFGKALGASGAYVAASQTVIELLIHRARSFVFSTAPAVPVMGAARAALAWLPTAEATQRRWQLARQVERFSRGLASLGLGPARSHIVPIRVREGDPRRAMAASDALLERGVFAQGIRSPTVPAGTSRLRFSLTALHTDDQIDRALAALAELRSLFA